MTAIDDHRAGVAATGGRSDEPVLVPGPVHLGRRRPRPSIVGVVVALVAFLLLPIALPLDDRLPAAVLVGVIALVALDTVGAWFRLDQVAPTITSPLLASTDHPVLLVVDLDGPAHRPVAVRLVGHEDGGRTDGVGRIELSLPVRFALVLDVIVIEMSVDGPVGLGSCARRSSHRLDRPIHVVPPAAATSVDIVPPGGRRTVDPIDVVGLREGRPGAPLRDVHWPSSIRTGRLIVRERRLLDDQLVRVAVALPTRSAAMATEIVAHARSVGATILAGGDRIELHSTRSSPLPGSLTLHADAPAAPGRLDVLPVRREIADAATLARELAWLDAGEVAPPERPYLLVDANGVAWVDDP